MNPYESEINHDPYESEFQRLQSIREYLYQPVNSNALPYRRIGHLHVTSGHADHCQFRVQGRATPCSCCHGSFTFGQANNFIETLFIQPAAELREKFVSTIAKIPESAGIGLANIDAMFSLGGAKAVVTSSFGTGNGSDGRHSNVLFGTNGVISRTLTHWESVIRDLFDLVDQLRAELFRMREEVGTLLQAPFFHIL